MEYQIDVLQEGMGDMGRKSAFFMVGITTVCAHTAGSRIQQAAIQTANWRCSKSFRRNIFGFEKSHNKELCRKWTARQTTSYQDECTRFQPPDV
ncbi:MAG: hypothetical protein ACLU7M_03390 [Mediterraneibacter gnavus]